MKLPPHLTLPKLPNYLCVLNYQLQFASEFIKEYSHDQKKLFLRNDRYLRNISRKYGNQQLSTNGWSNQGNKRFAHIFKRETNLKKRTLKSCLELKCQGGRLFWFASLCQNIKLTKWIAVFSTALSRIPTFCANYF